MTSRDPGATTSRKVEHVRINLETAVDSDLTAGFEAYRFIPSALPELDLDEIDTKLSVMGRALEAPLLISSMTGGAAEVAIFNRRLAEAAAERGIAMGVGSQRAALEDARQAESFRVRREAPNILLFANLGAVQLNYGYGVDECRRAVDMIEADALILHLNALQEALQVDGNTRWSGLLAKIERVCALLPVPVVVKEVGWGISADDALRLLSAGVAGLDVAGAGGTSWSEVERHRTTSPLLAATAAAFRGWGLPTAESLVAVREVMPNGMCIASGGIRDGLDVAKAVALGADLVGLAGPFLKAAAVSAEAVLDVIDTLNHTLRVTMFAVGVSSLSQLRTTPRLVNGQPAARAGLP